MKRLTLAASVAIVLACFGVCCLANDDAGKRPAISPAGPGALPVPAAGVKLPSFFSDNMVLQAGVKCPIWGAARPGSTVAIAIADQKASAKVGPDGQWRTTIGPLKLIVLRVNSWQT